MRTKPFLIIITLLFLQFRLYSQKSIALQDFNFVISKVQNDYPGYSDKVTPENQKQLDQLTNEIRQKIILLPDSCYYYMADWLSFFKDRHLRLEGNFNVWDETENKNDEEIANNSKEFKLNREEVEKQLLNTYNSKGIEGIWYSYNYGEIAIIQDSTELDKYHGISLKSTRYSKQNELFLELTDLPGDTFYVELYPEKLAYQNIPHVARRPKLNNVLEIDRLAAFVRLDLTKKVSFRESDALEASYNMQVHPWGYGYEFCSYYLSDSTFFMRVPSFRRSAPIQEILNNHWNDIMSRPNLIIDLRFNTGGQDYVFKQLLDIIYTDPYTKNGVEWYCSEGNIAEMESWLETGDYKGGEEGKKEIEEHVKIMKENVGGYCFLPNRGHDRIEKRDTVYLNPQNVGIIINNWNASSAESFLIHARNSSKVTLFGDTTKGVLDYSNSIPVDLPSHRVSLRYPMTRSTRLPENPIDNIGIAPDIFIPYEYNWHVFKDIDETVRYVEWYYELE